MFKKVIRVGLTLWYTKPVQIFYQIWYRIKNRFISINSYRNYDAATIQPVSFNFNDQLVLSQGKFSGHAKFFFIGLSHQFMDSRINWNFGANGKLWNYNLQYLDYILDESIDVIERKKILVDLSKELLAGKVKPEPYPVSLRIINTIAFVSRYGIQDRAVELALKRQIHYLENNLEFHILANHLIENIFSLFIASFALNNKKLYNKSKSLLEKQLAEQIMGDGAHYECSPMYHSILLAKILMLIDVVHNNILWQEDCKGMESVAAKMLGWLKDFSFYNNNWALVNDAANGIAPPLPVLEHVATSLNIHPQSTGLDQSGYRKWNMEIFELLVDAGSISPSYQPGHVHADMLSFWLNERGCPIFVDVGTSTYQVNERRQYERSTVAHNTVSINMDNQYDVWSGFRVARRAAIVIEKECENYLCAFHDGYLSRYGVIHQRSFLISPNNIIIEDKLKGKPVSAVAHFHLDHSISASHNAGENIVLLSNGIRMEFTNAQSIHVLSYKQATEFNSLIESQKIEVVFDQHMISKITIF
ncbi:MAG: heparinase II/III family protein [Sediminibacterium sp.]